MRGTRGSIERNDQNTIPLGFDRSQPADRHQSSLAIDPDGLDQTDADRTTPDAPDLLGEVACDFLHFGLPVVHVLSFELEMHNNPSFLLKKMDAPATQPQV